MSKPQVQKIIRSTPSKEEKASKKETTTKGRPVFSEVIINHSRHHGHKMMDVLGSGSSAAEEFKENLDNIVMCQDCKEFPPNLVEEFSSGDLVCGTCGLVVPGRIVDTRSEWRTFANDDQNNDDPSRVGDAGNPLFEDSVGTLQTNIGRDGSNAFHLQRAQNKTVEKGSKALKEGFAQIKQFVDTLQAGNVVRDSAQHIYKLVEDGKVMKGKPQEAIIAGCIFIACRSNNTPRTFREIYNLTHVSKKEIGRVFKQLESYLIKKQMEDPTGSLISIQNVAGFQSTSSTSASDLVTRYISNLGIRNQALAEKVAKALAAKTSSVPDLAGRSPLSVAAACIYMASHLISEPKTSKEIANIAGVSDGTIKTAYRFLYQARETLITADLLPNVKASLDKLPPN